MRVRVQENGNTYEVSALTHGRALKMLDMLRHPVPTPEPKDEGPKVVGTGSSVWFANDRDYESRTPGKVVPVVFGFVPNEVNHGSAS